MDRPNGVPPVKLLDDVTSLLGKGEATSLVEIYDTAYRRRQLSPPRSLMTIDEKAVASLQDYSLRYIVHEGDHDHEPQVRQFTIQGKFGEQMQDGLAHLMRNSPQAFLYFRRGFKLVESLVCSCHPMAIAQYLAVVYILATNEAQGVIEALRRHVAKMASTLNLPRSALEVLAAVYSSEDVLSTAIVCLRAAIGKFIEQKPTSW